MIKYKDGYKHQLYEDAFFQIRFSPPEEINTQFITFSVDGLLTGRKGYAWDGASGPTWDNFQFRFWKKKKKVAKQGSLVHDMLCQLMRMGLLDRKFRFQADAELKRICIEDGMWKQRAKVWVFMLKKFAKDSVTKKGERKIITAP